MICTPRLILALVRNWKRNKVCFGFLITNEKPEFFLVIFENKFRTSYLVLPLSTYPYFVRNVEKEASHLYSISKQKLRPGSHFLLIEYGMAIQF